MAAGAAEAAASVRPPGTQAPSESSSLRSLKKGPVLNIPLSILFRSERTVTSALYGQ